MAEFTEARLVEICKEDGLYRTPSVNDKLYLNNRGFTVIDPEVMCKYYNLKCLWFQGNGLQKIEGLEKLTELRALYMHENVLETIEGLETLTNLRTLNLGSNFLTTIENLDALQSLETLHLGHNTIGPDLASIEHVLKLPNLQTLDLQANQIQDGDALLSLVKQMPKLRVLYCQGNPFIKKFRNYRKRVIAACTDLRYLDDRPVFEDERRRSLVWAEVFATGSVDDANKAEREEIEKIRDEKRQAETKRIDDFEAFIAKAKATPIVVGPKAKTLTCSGELVVVASVSTEPRFVNFYELD